MRGYIDDNFQIASDAADGAFLSDDVEGNAEASVHLLIDIGIVDQILSFEQIFNLTEQAHT